MGSINFGTSSFSFNEPGDGSLEIEDAEGDVVAKFSNDLTSLIALETTAIDLANETGSDGRIYQHNGASSITADGASTSQTGYYVWSATDSEWKELVVF